MRKRDVDFSLYISETVSVDGHLCRCSLHLHQEQKQMT